jgi:hypothetical protein
VGVRLFEFFALQSQLVSQPEGRAFFLMKGRAPGELCLVVGKAFERPLGQPFGRA